MRRAPACFPRRPASFALAGAALVFALLAVSMRMATGDPPEAMPPGLPQDRPGLLDADPSRLEPRLLDLRALLELERAQLEPLRAAFREASDPHAAAEIAARIKSIRTMTELEVLRAQLEHARKQAAPGHVAALEALLAPASAASVPQHAVSPARRRDEAGR